jgi:hypothetical protein
LLSRVHGYHFGQKFLVEVDLVRREDDDGDDGDDDDDEDENDDVWC